MLENCYPGHVGLPDWNQPETRQIGRMPPHAYLVPFPGMADCMHALSDNPRYLSDYVHSLNGLWQSRHFTSVLQMPENILTYRSGFDEVQIPQPPTARQTANESLLVYPYLDGDQPVRVYRRHCRLPLTWSGLRKRLVLHGVGAAFHAYINGRFVGYSEGTGLPAEFDVTQHIHDQDNDLFLIVWPRCNGSLVEPEDELPLSSIFRDVYLEAVPPVSLYDLDVETIWQKEEGSWLLKLSMQFISYRISMEQPVLQLRLRQNETDVLKENWPVHLQSIDREDARWPSPVQAEAQLEIEAPLHGVSEWNHETPCLYDLYLSLSDEKGQEHACYHRSIGFRSLSQDEEGYKINGRPLKLQAAIWQESRYWQEKPSIPGMVKALRDIKRQGLCALWIKDLAVDPIFLELCDLYGLYVIEDVPLDPPQALLAQMNDDFEFWHMAEDRLARLIHRDRQHACIVAWSCGLWQHQKPLETPRLQSLRDMDRSRFWHHQDLPCLHQPLEAWLGNDAQDRGMKLLNPKTPLPEAGLAWGSWLPPSANGACSLPLLQEDGKPGAYLREIRHRLRPLTVDLVDATAAAFTFHNQQILHSASDFSIRWVLLRDGAFHLSGELDPLSIAPGESLFREIWLGDDALDEGAQFVLRFEVSSKRRTLWHRSGQEISHEEFCLQEEARTRDAEKKSRGHLRLDRDRHHLIVSGPRFWLVFNAVTAGLESWRLGEAELIGRDDHLGGLRPAMRRFGDLLDAPMIAWWQSQQILDPCRQVKSVQHLCDGQSARITFVESLGRAGCQPLFELCSRYEIRASGKVDLSCELAPLAPGETLLPPHPGLCLRLPLRRDFGKLTWRGKGPQPVFFDRSQSAQTGLFHLQPDELAKSQADGLVHPQCHWLHCENEEGLGLSIYAETPFSHAASMTQTSKSLRRPQTIDVQILPGNARSREAPLKAWFRLRPLLHLPGRS